MIISKMILMKAILVNLMKEESHSAENLVNTLISFIAFPNLQLLYN